MITTFDDFAIHYNSWRRTGFFYSDFEVPLANETLRNAVLRLHDKVDILDIGTGTGIWCEAATRIATQFHKLSSAIGIDTSKSMIAQALESSPGTAACYQHLDCISLDNSSQFGHRFSLITLALSLDYIGIANAKVAVDNYLAEDGVAIFWIFDPKRYNSFSHVHRKKWSFAGLHVEFAVPAFSIEDVCRQFTGDRWNIHSERYALPYVDDVDRGLYFFAITRHNQCAPDVHSILVPQQQYSRMTCRYENGFVPAPNKRQHGPDTQNRGKRSPTENVGAGALEKQGGVRSI